MPMKMGDINAVEWQPREGGGLAKPLCPGAELVLVSEEVTMRFPQPGEHLFLVLQGDGRGRVPQGLMALGSGITFAIDGRHSVTLAPLPSEELILLHLHPSTLSWASQDAPETPAVTPAHAAGSAASRTAERQASAPDAMGEPPSSVPGERVTPPVPWFASRPRAKPTTAVGSESPLVVTVDNVSVGEGTPAEPVEETAAESPTARSAHEEPTALVQPAKRRRRNWYLRD
ncbi:MAG: hypothetical protein IRZ18_03870 [Clostridia bacterium]|nr:hypothetical protein [Clostridia bacterium]